MATKIFVNLPVKDINGSKDFFTKIGFTINPSSQMKQQHAL
jgi:predicted lactoylglutathione lyase